MAAVPDPPFVPYHPLRFDLPHQLPCGEEFLNLLLLSGYPRDAVEVPKLRKKPLEEPVLCY